MTEGSAHTVAPSQKRPMRLPRRQLISLVFVCTCVATSGSVGAWEARRGQLLWTDDFDDGVLDGWHVTLPWGHPSSNWRIEGGELTSNGMNGSAVALVEQGFRERWSHIVFEGDIFCARGVISGLLFYVTNPEATGPGDTRGLQIEFRMFDYQGLYSQGPYVVSVRPSQAQFPTRFLVPVDERAYLREDDWNTFALWITPTHIAVDLNGSRALDADLADLEAAGGFAEGDFAALAESAPTTAWGTVGVLGQELRLTNVFRYDNFRVHALEELDPDPTAVGRLRLARSFDLELDRHNVAQSETIEARLVALGDAPVRERVSYQLLLHRDDDEQALPIAAGDATAQDIESNARTHPIPVGADADTDLRVEARLVLGDTICVLTAPLFIRTDLPMRLSAVRRELDRVVEGVAESDLLAHYAASVTLRVERAEEIWGEGARPRDVVFVEEQVQWAQRALPVLAAGQDPLAGAHGLLERGYRSGFDGTVQPYALYVPRDYDPAKAWPLIVALHGGGDNTHWAIPRRAARLQGRLDAPFLMLAPYSRGTWWEGPGMEAEIFRLIDEVAGLYNVDRHRVSVTGQSMGGYGAWHLGLRYPDRFATIAPAGGGHDPRLVDNARHLPVLVVQGERDNAVPPDKARMLVQRLRKLGYGVEYAEYPRVGHAAHELFYATGALETWVNLKRIQAEPRGVTYRTDDLRYNRAYWVRIDALSRPFSLGQIEAEVLDGETIEVRLAGVDAYTLFPTLTLVDSGAELTVRTGDQVSYRGEFKPEIQVRVAGPKLKARHKRSGLSGPISDAFRDRFMYVYGTSGSPKATEANETRARAAAGSWGRFPAAPWQAPKATLPVKADREVTREDIAGYHLILFGDAASNRLIASANTRLPVHFAEEGVVLAGRDGPVTYRGSDVGLAVIYPNPNNPERYVVIQGGSPRATEALASLGSFWAWPDYVIYSAAGYPEKPPRILARGYFNRNWEPYQAPVAGRLAEGLGTSGLVSSFGSFRAEAAMQALSTDLALVARWAARDSLPPGDVTIVDLALASDNQPIVGARVRGRELLAWLEWAVYGDRSPHPSAGLTYQIDRTKPEGKRIVEHNVEPDRMFSVALEAPLVLDGRRNLGELVDYELTDVGMLDAQIIYLESFNAPYAPTPPTISEARAR